MPVQDSRGDDPASSRLTAAAAEPFPKTWTACGSYSMNLATQQGEVGQLVVRGGDGHSAAQQGRKIEVTLAQMVMDPSIRGSSWNTGVPPQQGTAPTPTTSSTSGTTGGATGGTGTTGN